MNGDYLFLTGQKILAADTAKNPVCGKQAFICQQDFPLQMLCLSLHKLKLSVLFLTFSQPGVPEEPPATERLQKGAPGDILPYCQSPYKKVTDINNHSPR